MNISADVLERFAAELLAAGGFARAEAEATAASLVRADLLGYDSHGVIRVPEYVRDLAAGVLKSGAEISITRETVSSIAADAGQGLGQVQMPRFLDVLLAKSETEGVVSGALRNCGHVGRLGEWVEYLAAQGRAGFVFVNDNGALQAVAPPGGREGRTSTNPMAFGVPLGEGKAFTFDMSTSATALGRVRVAQLSGKALAEGLVQDAEGRPSTDPGVMFSEPHGSLLPMGGYKGFGLAMMVDCLVAGLSGGFAPPAPEGALLLNNVLVTVWNPALFSGAAHMRREAEKYLAFVRETAPIDPAAPVRVPGDRARETLANRRKSGIPLSSGSRDALRVAAAERGVSIPEVF